MITKLAHTCLQVSDVHRSIEFYSQKLALPVRFTFEKHGKLNGAYFDCGNSSYIEIFEVPFTQVTNTTLVHFCFETDNIDQFIAGMKAKGVDCTEKKIGSDETWQTWLQDPDGNKFEIHQYTPKSFQRAGGVAQVTW